MAQLEEITADLLDKKYLFNGFGQGKLQFDAPTLIRVYQVLLSVHSDGFNYEEEDSTSAAHHLLHICRCLRLLGIGHLAPKSQDLVDKSRALRIISALDDKISAKYKSHVAARRIRVVLKKEQTSKSKRPKPRPPTVQEDSSQDEVFPTVPLPKPCELQQKPVPQKTNPIPKAVQTKGNQPPAPKVVLSPPVTPESQRDFIPSGQQLQRTPVATSKMNTTPVQFDKLPSDPVVPFAMQLENSLHCKAELPLLTNTCQSDCKADVTVSSVSSQLDDDTCHKAGNALSSSIPSELYCNFIQSDLEKEECVQSHSSLDTLIPPVPSSSASLPAVPPQTDHGVYFEAEVSCEKKPNIIPTGQQIPRTPRTPKISHKLGVEGDLSSSNEETTEISVAKNTPLLPDTPERCRERDHSTQGQEENKNVEKDVCNIAPLSSVPSPLEAYKMLSIKSPADGSLPVDEGLPVHCVFSPPSGYRDDETCSKTNTETLEGKCSPFGSETTFTVNNTGSPASVVNNYDCPTSSVRSCKKSSFAVNNRESLTSNNENSFSSVSNNESPSSAVTISKSPTSIGSDNERTFVSSNENLCHEAGNLEKVMKNSIESTDYTAISCLKQDAMDEQKCLVPDENNISALCENIEINCSLKENCSPGGSGGEMNYTGHGTPLVQDATYVVSTKKLVGNSNHRETNIASWKDLDGTYIVPAKINFNESISSGTNVTNIQEVRRDEPMLDTPFKVDNGTFISQIQNEELLSISDNDDTLEIFPHKHKASRGKEKHTVSSGMFTNTSKKLPEKMDEGEDDYCKETEDNYSEANKNTGDKLECTVIKEPFMYPKVSKKKRLDKENCIEYEADPLGEKECGTGNFEDLPHLDKNVKLVLKDSNKKAKKARVKVRGKEVSTLLDTRDKEENTRSRQRKGSAQKKTCNVTDVNEQRETNVDGVKREVHKRRCKEAKNYDENLSPYDSEDSWMSIEKKGTKSKGHAKNRKEKQSSRLEKEMKSKDDAVKEEYTEEDKAIQSHAVVKEQASEKGKDVDHCDIERKGVKPKGQPKKSSYKDTEKAVGKEEDSSDNVGRKTVKTKGHQKKKSEDNDKIVTNKCENVREENIEVDTKAVKSKGRPKKHDQKNNEMTSEKGSDVEDHCDKERKDVKPKGRPKKSSYKETEKTVEKCVGKEEDSSDNVGRKTVKTKGHPRKLNQENEMKVEKCVNLKDSQADSHDNVGRRNLETKGHPMKQNQKNNEMRVKNCEVKTNVDQACGNEAEKKSKYIRGKSKKKNDEQPCTEVTQGRTCKLKAIQGISDIFNDSFS